VPKEPYLVAIDFGSNSIKLAVAKESIDEQDKIQILALVERPSRGIRRGIVTNMSEATEALIDIVNQAEGIIGLPIRRAVVGINGLGVSFTNSDGLVVVSRQDNEISEQDVDRVIQDSLTKAFGIQNNEIIHVIPKSFSIDNQDGIRYPVGMVGSKLVTKTLVVSVETSYLRNFTKVFNQASIEIANQFFSPLATSDVILTSRQKKAGTVLVDIGYASTSYIVWENEEIFSTGIIPIGSDHITADLAVGLQTTMEMAEDIKKQHLQFTIDEESDLDDKPAKKSQKKILETIQTVEMYNPDLQKNEAFKTNEITTYARARAEELFHYLNKELRKIGKNSQLPGGVVLVGGGSSLTGIEDIAKDVLKLPIFKYTFDRNSIDFVPDYNNDPSFINSIALAAYSLYHSEEAGYTNKLSRGLANGHRNQVGETQKNIMETIKKFLPWG
jgi:cell division protein FtsA